MSLLKYEKLCIEVQKLPRIFDKSLACYKESQPKKNAWKCIDKHKTLVKLVKELRSTIGNSRKAVNKALAPLVNDQENFP